RALRGRRRGRALRCGAVGGLRRPCATDTGTDRAPTELRERRMHLKRIEIAGFKSFAEPTTIDLTPGLTAIVGPNGCGKSNVVDAIRWALGEQSARSLRGGVMADVIFSGGGRRAPLGLAEVTLRFDNRCRTLEIDRDEVQVTRRLYRSGESEYRIDGKRARLRDVRELLMDTGAGARAATFVEQGRIDALLHASPHERRQVLEEAAGIGKFKVRRKEALRRLAEVSESRERLEDVYREVVRQHKRLERQARKAKRYVALRDELRGLIVRLAHAHRARLLDRLAGADERLRTHRARLPELRAERAACAAELEALRTERAALESTVRREELELRDIEAGLASCREQAAAERRRAAECREDLAREQRAIEALEAKLERLDAEIAAGREAAEKQKGADRGLALELERHEAQLAELDRRAASLREQLEAAKNAAVAALQAEARTRNRVAELEARARVLAGRQERLTRKLRQTEAQLAEQRAELEELAADVEERETQAQALADRAREARERRERAETTLREAEERFLGTRQSLAETEAQLAALQALEREGAGLGAGVRAVLGYEDERVLGTVAQQLDLEPEHAPALAAALGPRAQWVVVRDRETALELLYRLEQEEAGHCPFLPLDAPRRETPARPHLEAETGFLGWLADRVRIAAESEAVLRPLLDGIALVETLDDALEIVTAGLAPCCVTPDGMLCDASGRIAGGSAPSDDPITRRGRRTALEAERARHAEALERIRGELEQLRATIRESAALAERLQAEYQEARLGAFAARRGCEERGRLLARLAEEQRLTRTELEEVIAQREAAEEEREELEEACEEGAGTAAEHERRAGELQAACRQIELERDAARDALSDLRVQLARGAEQWEALRRAARRAEAERGETLASLERARRDRQRAEERIEAAEARLHTLTEQAQRLERERTERRAALERNRSRLQELRKRHDEHHERHAALERSITEAQAIVAGAERDRREAQERLAELASRVRQELGLELEALPAPDPGPGEVGNAPTTAAFNEREAEARCVEIRKSMASLGGVNLEALEECEQVAERRAFLEKQRKDLERAERNLRASIRKINETCRRRFLETFEGVRGHFRDIFRKLFGGGKADLVLEKDRDLLEAGVEVIARPPGKQARRLSLLSGGEKTMTT
ncbi:MAG: chromosome segregation protein SMC, partial [Planctomycetota bacterium]